MIAEGASPNAIPKAPNAVSHEMNRAAPVLRRLGIHYYADPNTRTRIKHLERATAASPEKSATTATTATGASNDRDDSGRSDDPATGIGIADIDPAEIERLAELARWMQQEGSEPT